MVHYAEVPAACTKTGVKEHYECDKCHRYYLDKEGTQEVTYEELIIDALGHDTTRYEEDRVEATCTTPGHFYIVVKCKRCGEVVSRTVVSQPRKGHDWGEATYTWSADNGTVTAKRICKNDPSHMESETAAAKSEVTKQPTCTEAGVMTYTVTFNNEGFAPQTKTEEIPATGHDWDTPVYEWAADNSTVTATKTCKNNPDHVVSETVQTTASVTKLPTCTEKGETTYTAEFKDASFTAQKKTLSDVEPLGHDYSDPVYIWADDNSTVTARRTCNRCGEVEEETVIVKQEVTVKPTCTEKGTTKYTAEFENKTFRTQTKTVVDIDATGHSWDEGVVTKEATCEENGVMTYTCRNDHSHTREEVIEATGHKPAPAVIENIEAATCTNEGGYDEVIYCENCHKEMARDHHIEPALGHNWGEWKVIKEATEDEDGLERRECARCHETEERAIPHIDHVHEMEHYDEVPATCTKTGVMEHYECKKCHRYYLDEEGTQEVTLEDLTTETTSHTIARKRENVVEPTCTTYGHYDMVIYCEKCGEVISRTIVSQPRKGHDWGEATYTWSADNGTVTAERTCKNDPSHVERETAVTTSAVTKEATCTEAGERTYTATFSNEGFAPQTKTEEIPAKGHDWDAPVYTWSSDNSTVTATKTCLNDPSETVSETVKTTSKVTKQPTCTGKGEMEYTAVFTDPSFRSQTKTALIDETGHNWGEPVYEWSYDNRSVTAKRICQNDSSHIETETVTTNAEVTKPATCTEKGETTYTAVFSGSAFKVQTKTVTDIDATGHAWDTPVYEWAADNSTVTATTTCKNDPAHTVSETVQTASSVTKLPTCTEKGETTYTAEFENASFTMQKKTLSNVEPLGHDFSDPVYIWANDNSTVTARRTCNRCGET